MIEVHHGDMANEHKVQDIRSAGEARQRFSERRRLAVNITPIERWGRIVLGLAAVIVAVVLLGSATSTVAVVLEVLLALAGLNVAATGALGHCSLYQKLGFVPSSLRRPT